MILMAALPNFEEGYAHLLHVYINELHSLGEIIPRNKFIRKILSVLPGSWESKVNAITEAKDLQELTIDEFVDNLKTYEMKKKKKDNERREPKKEKNLVLKMDSNDSGGEDAGIAYLTKRFQKVVRRNEGIPKRGSSSKIKGYDLCHKCGKPGHFIKDFPLLKQDQYKYNTNKAAKRNQVPNKQFKRKDAADNVVKQTLAIWGDSSSKSEEDDNQGDSSMMEVESETTEYDSIFSLIAKSDNDEDDDDDDEVNFLDVQRNLKSYSLKKLMSLANVLIYMCHSLINDKDALIVELGEAKQLRDDLVVVVVDLKETIESLNKEKDALTKKIANIEHARDDLVVFVVDLKETIECVKKEKEILIERVSNIKHQRDDLLVVVVDLKEIIEELKRESRPGNTQKGKEVVSEAHLRLEDELKSVKSSLCAELEKNRQLQEDLGKVKNDLEKSLKWTWSSDAITTMYINSGGNRQGIGFQREKTPYNPHRKYVTVTMKGSSQQWYMDSGCLKHMTGSKNDFLSVKALQGGSVSFGNGKKGYILGVGRIGKSLSHSIENVYYVNGLKYNLLSVSQICDKGNKVEFVSKMFTVTNIMTGEVVLVAKRYKNIYVADFESLQNGDLNCLSDVDDNAKLWHRRTWFVVCLSQASRITRTKDETFQVFVAFVKKIQVKMSHNVASPRTPQQNGVVERKNKTLDMARTMLIDSGIAKGF
ncbi:intracellular protein transport protein USO1-like [Nicotiana sylvestris]|uniref:intracellular protein transport protein USO1-like n=1 Tax=Nicotiana sylvestris TaxID=4096 RepID=UPI00388CCF2B